MNIANVAGITQAQIERLIALGAVEHPSPT
jgi:hypothetical protein